MNIFLSPHNDDETLFGAFTILRFQPHVVICLRSQVQEDRHGLAHQIREFETQRALWWLAAPSWRQLITLDTDPRYMEKAIGDFALLDKRYEPEIVWAPAIEDGGHEQHNGIALAASEVFGERVRAYLTYRRGSMRSRGFEVPFEPSWIATKMRALSCYGSQHELTATRAWFMDDTLREYVPHRTERVKEEDGA